MDHIAHHLTSPTLTAWPGNKPPWTLPAKAKYSAFDRDRAVKYFKTPYITSPEFFPILSVFVSNSPCRARVTLDVLTDTFKPQRCMIYVKDNFPREKFEQAFLTLWDYNWVRHIDPSKPEGMTRCLSEHFTEAQVRDSMGGAQQPKYKQALTDQTKKCVASGAFGAPWFLVTNGEGKTEPFFGSDRYVFAESLRFVSWC